MARKTVSLLTFFSFLAIILSSLALYVLPGGRNVPLEQALLFGIHKSIWKDIHITGGFLFLGAAVWHTLLNMRVLVTHLKKSVGISARSCAPMLAAVGITAFVYAGTVCGLEPMNSVLAFGKSAQHKSAVVLMRNSPQETRASSGS